MELELEIQTYESQRDELMRQHSGRFVVIAGKDVLGTYDTQEDALDAGYERVGLKPFLVKRIQAVDPVLNLALR